LSHPNTVTIFDYGRTPDDIFYYAMELLEGADLAVLVRASGAQPPARVAHILERVADALAEAHGIGLIHRDIKPSNIVLCSRGGKLDVPKVVDFGLVRQLGDAAEMGLTGEGSILGTPLYLAPESIRGGGAVDGRADLYALGAVGYYLLTGSHLFGGSQLLEICWKHLETPPEPPSERLGRPVPAALEQVLLDCLEKDPDKRPQTAADLRDRLRACVASLGPWGQVQAEEWWARNQQASPALQGSELEDSEERETQVGTIVVQRRSD
ncbi:MAG: serine/threonine-protein kinase, partial [Myxococcota bacterium]|nr:serine/threonine-protein kinase [Myxococcota bacterium]